MSPPETEFITLYHSSSDDSESTSLGTSLTPQRIGFVGFGTIASAIATGLATQQSVPISYLAVSRRSEKRSSALQKSFPDLVSIHDDNQQVVDTADIIFLCVLPEQTSSVLQKLKFDAHRHTLVSLVSTSTIEDLCRDAQLPPERVFKMICLPAVARCNGICLLLTPTQKDPPILTELCEALGGCVQARDAQQMSALMVTTCLMGSFYGVLRNNREFLVRHGLDRDQASFLVGRLYDSMVQDAVQVQKDPNGFDQLIAEQTPGGLNEQGLRNLEALGALDAYDQVQTAILSRILGESDGSLPFESR
jgi:pyrroline-5-carboxylate reductase